MSTFDTLPIVLISAINESAATEVINELVDNEVTEEYNKDQKSADRVWRLVNKYYSADVRVHTLTDDKRLDVDPATVEAHIIHITKDEISDNGSAGARRAAAALGAWRHCAVRVVLADSAGGAELAALRDWALATRAELAPWREAAPAPRAGPFAAQRGLQRARQALHAHVWPNLVRQAARPPLSALHASAECSSSAESSEGEEEEEEADELRAVERAEAFVAALDALGAEPRGAELPPLPAHARIDRAEQLLAAFCHALGLHPADL